MSIAPVKGFVEGFNSIGVKITNEMARKPMGMLKLDHTRAIAKMLDTQISEEEILKAYKAFEEVLFSGIENHCDIKDYVLDTIAALRQNGIKIGSTTEYTSAMMAKVLPKAVEGGYSPDFCAVPDIVGKGRPFPYMIWENMKQFGIINPLEVVKVGDAVSDIEEGKRANCWTVGVILGSSEFGLSRDEFMELTAEEIKEHKKRVRATYYKTGADYIIEDMNELPSVIADINRKLAQNEPHLLLTPGPLTTKDNVKKAMLTDHCTWDDEYKAITTSVMNDITAVSANNDYATVLLQGSGSYAVESMINCLSGNEKMLLLVNGEYGKRIVRMATDAGKSFDVLEFSEVEPVDAQKLEEKLKSDSDIKIVVTVHCETTTGVINPLEEIVEIAKKYGKKVFVDAMSSFRAYEIDIAKMDIDALASSANKCLEGLPGLAFVIAKKSLIEKNKGNSKSHSLDLFDQYEGLYAGGEKFRFTSPTNILLALREAIDQYKNEGGLTARRERYMENHRILVDGLAKLSIKSIVDKENQSYIITTFDLGNLNFNKLYNTLKSKGFIIYPGKLTQIPTFGIGNVFPSDMQALVKAIGEYVNA